MEQMVVMRVIVLIQTQDCQAYISYIFAQKGISF